MDGLVLERKENRQPPISVNRERSIDKVREYSLDAWSVAFRRTRRCGLIITDKGDTHISSKTARPNLNERNPVVASHRIPPALVQAPVFLLLTVC